MRARNVDEYRAAWTRYIESLASLALAANIPYHQFVEVKERMESWLEDATAMFEQERSEHE